MIICNGLHCLLSFNVSLTVEIMIIKLIQISSSYVSFLIKIYMDDHN